MKKILLVSLLVFTGVVATTNAVFSQESTDDLTYSTNVRDLLPPSNYETVTINAKAMRAFKKEFAIANEQKWYKMKDGYSVAFKQDDIAYRVDYSKKGAWSGTLKNYTETKLNKNIRATIKSVYFDYDIKWVWEIDVPIITGGPVYIIHIEDGKGFKNIHFYDGEMKVLEQFQK